MKNKLTPLAFLLGLMVISMSGCSSSGGNESVPLVTTNKPLENTNAVVETSITSAENEEILIVPESSTKSAEEIEAANQEAIEVASKETPGYANFIKEMMTLPVYYETSMEVLDENSETIVITTKAAYVSTDKYAVITESTDTDYCFRQVLNNGKLYNYNYDDMVVYISDANLTTFENYTAQWIESFSGFDYENAEYTTEVVEIDEKKYRKDSCEFDGGLGANVVYTDPSTNEIKYIENGGDIVEFKFTHEIDESLFDVLPDFSVSE